jgi:hypothetical protein
LVVVEALEVVERVQVVMVAMVGMGVFKAVTVPVAAAGADLVAVAALVAQVVRVASATPAIMALEQLMATPEHPELAATLVRCQYFHSPEQRVQPTPVIPALMA